MVASVIFYRTVRTGQEVAATVSMTDSGVVVEGRARMAEMLFRGVDPDDQDAMLIAMRDAPRRYDGSYLRAEYREG